MFNSSPTLYTQTRPVSEISPIKAELETIIGQKTGSLQRTSVKPIVITTKTVKEAEEVMVPASEEEEQAQKAAVKAIEVAFMRKRMAANAAATNDAANDESVEGETGPVPATRRSIKRRDVDPR